MKQEQGESVEEHINLPTQEPIHTWFNLTYSSYLVLPRSLLQSMPLGWQQRFVRLLQQMEECFEYLHGGSEPMPSAYDVRVRGEKGRFGHDPYADYARGRRFVEPRPASPLPESEDALDLLQRACAALGAPVPWCLDEALPCLVQCLSGKAEC